MDNKLAIGFITFSKKGTEYLPYFLGSIKKQSFRDFRIVAVDCAEDGDHNQEIIKNYPEVEIIGRGENLGYGKSFNLMINHARNSDAEYFLVVNPDIAMEADAIEKMLGALDNDSSLASVSPKIYKWNFNNLNDNEGKTNLIDSFGLVMKSGLRFFDLGQGQSDSGQFDDTEILGPSGAAAMYRITALEKVKFDGQYFDERMFMYKEDCDLAYRLNLVGFGSRLVTEAKVYHDRTASAIGESKIKIAMNRKNKNRQVKIWSLSNQLLIYKKYWQIQSFFNKLSIVWHVLLMFLFCLLFERYLLKEFMAIVKKYDKE